MFVEGRKPSAVRYKQSYREAWSWTGGAMVPRKSRALLIPYGLQLMAPDRAGPRPLRQLNYLVPALPG